MEPKNALLAIRQVVESVNLNFKDHQYLQEALKTLERVVEEKEKK